MQRKDLQEELKQSMLARNELKTSVLRMLLSSIGYLETQRGGAGYEATEEDVMSSIQKKQSREKIPSRNLKSRASELADKEKKNLRYCKNIYQSN